MTDERERPDADARWEAVARFLAGESDPDEERRIRDELARDAERAALVNALDGALAAPHETPLSPREVEAALASVMARRDGGAAAIADPRVVPFRPTRSASATRWRSAGLRAAAVILVVAGAGLVWRATRSDVRPGDDGRVATAAARVYRTAPGRVDTLRLADGSSVVLGPASTLTLQGSFGDGARETTLDGVAYFDVVHDDARPFVVRTASATLRDIGTTFTVRSDSASGTRVAVTSGVVDVVATTRSGAAPTVLHAGDWAEVSGGVMRVERGTVSESELAWTRGVLEFRDAPLAVVREELFRWYGVKLVVTDSTIARRRLTATFDRATSEEIGRVLAAALGGSVTRAGNTLHLGAAARR